MGPMRLTYGSSRAASAIGGRLTLDRNGYHCWQTAVGVETYLVLAPR
jgi:hypothetical protein